MNSNDWLDEDLIDKLREELDEPVIAISPEADDD